MNSISQQQLEEAIACHVRGDFAKARALYQRLLQENPAEFNVLQLLGTLSAQTGDPKGAVSLIDRAIAIEPDHAALHMNKGAALQDLADWQRALESFATAARLEPQLFEAQFRCGDMHQALLQWSEARTCYQRALAILPCDAAAHAAHGFVLVRLGQPALALSSLDRAIELGLDSLNAFLTRAALLLQARRLQDSLASYDQVISRSADCALAHLGRGNVLHDLADHVGALSAFDRALELDPSLADAHLNRGAVLRDLYRLAEALTAYDRALELRPDWSEAHYNRGNVLYEQRAAEDAISSYDRALELRPDYVDAAYNRSLALLLAGDYERGWREYESRWRLERGVMVGERRHFPQPRWHGERDVAGRSILLYSEQGFGDALQFCRYARQVAGLGAKVILETHDPLVSLFRSLQGVSQVVRRGEPLPPFDLQCPLMSLPAAFGTSLTSVPAVIPYLSCDPAVARVWATRLGERRGLRVGLVWAGGIRSGVSEPWVARRNIPLEKFAPLRVAGVEFFSLQKGEEAEAELATAVAGGWDGPKVVDHSLHLRDFADTAGLVHQLDLVISVDTSTVHLAGAMGTPVWLLDRFDHCWRWLRDRSDSAWYPTLRIYRQRSSRTWEDVVDRVSHDLRALAANR